MHVLVIEDEMSVVKVVRLFLKPLGIDVTHSTDYETSRQPAATADAILCDVHLGEENGVEVVQRLRRDGFAGRVIMTSGDRCSAATESSLKAEVSGYLPKPFTRAMLLEKLECPSDLRGTLQP